MAHFMQYFAEKQKFLTMVAKGGKGIHPRWPQPQWLTRQYLLVTIVLKAGIQVLGCTYWSV